MIENVDLDYQYPEIPNAIQAYTKSLVQNKAEGPLL